MQSTATMHNLIASVVARFGMTSGAPTSHRRHPVASQQRVYLDGKIYVVRGSNIVRVK